MAHRGWSRRAVFTDKPVVSQQSSLRLGALKGRFAEKVRTSNNFKRIVSCLKMPSEELKITKVKQIFNI